MKSKSNARILVVGNTLEASLFDLMLKPAGHETQVLAFADEDLFGYQTILSTHKEKILKAILDFRPHLIALTCDGGFDEFLVKLEEAFKEGNRPPIIALTGRDGWCPNADACLSSPVDPDDLLQTVENLLQKRVG